MSKSTINVGLVGCGSMGRGVAMQINATPGMGLAWAADTNETAASGAAVLAGCVSGYNVTGLLEQQPVDVMVEATNNIDAAADYWLQSASQRRPCCVDER